MPVMLDPDAAAVYKAFQEAGRPAYETLTAPEAREYYLAARFVSNPEPPALESVDVLEPGAAWCHSGAALQPEKTARDGWPRSVPGVFSRRRLGDRQPRFP
jgi:acetyl esterase